MSMRTTMPEADVAVVGAGPAGLAAAVRLGAAGVTVAVLDEYPVPGGRLRGQRYRTRDGWFVGRDEAERLVSAAAGTGRVTVHCGVSVYGVSRTREGFLLEADGPVTAVRARALLVATGATETPVPLPGWTLPGVMAVGAAQVLAAVWGVKPGEVGVVVGASPLGFAIAQELAWAGVALNGIVMPPPHPATSHLGSVQVQWARLSTWHRAAPWWARPGARLLGSPRWQSRILARWPVRGIPLAGTRVRLSVAALGIEGRDHVVGIRLTRLDGKGRPVGRPWVESVDFVALAGGLRPIPDLVQAAGATMVQEPGLGGEVPLVGPDGATTVPGLFAAGNTTGVAGARVAMAEGQVAALGILRYLQGPGTVSEREWKAARAAVSRAWREAPLEFQPGAAAAREHLERRWHAWWDQEGEAMREHGV